MVDELPGQLAVVHDMGRITNYSTAKLTMTAPEGRQAKDTRLDSAQLVSSGCLSVPAAVGSDHGACERVKTDRRKTVIKGPAADGSSYK